MLLYIIFSKKVFLINQKLNWLNAGDEKNEPAIKEYCSESLVFNQETEMCDIPQNVVCPGSESEESEESSEELTCSDSKVKLHIKNEKIC